MDINYLFEYEDLSFYKVGLPTNLKKKQRKTN